MNSKLEHSWKTLGTINEWIRFADTKAGGVLGIVGIIASIMLSVLAGTSGNLPSHDPLLFLFLVLGIISGCGSTYFAVHCLNPTLNVSEPTSLIYFAHIVHKFKTSASYQQAIGKGLADDQMLSQIADQIWANSKVAWRKYRSVTWAIRFLTLTILITITGIMIAII